MSGGFRLTQTAESELEAILVGIASRDGMGRALNVHARFSEAFELLGEQPSLGTTRVELTGRSLRWWPVFRWVVIYDPTPSPITILRVLYGPRDLEAILADTA